MNTGVLLGVANQNFDLKKKNLVNVSGIVIGQVAPPVGAGTWLHASDQPALNAVNPGNVQFMAPRLTSTGAYKKVLDNASKFYGAWVLNDTIEFVGNGQTAIEMGGLYVRPEIHSNDGQGTNKTIVGQDIFLTVKGTDTVGQIVGFFPGVITTANATNVYSTRAYVQTPDNAGNALGTVTLYQGFYTNGSTTTVATLIGLDLSLVNAAAGNISNSWGIQVGTANNYFAGKSSFGSTGVPTYTVDATGTVRASDSSTTVAGFVANMSGTPAASTVLAGFSDTSSMPLGTNASAIYASLYAAPSITGASPTATYIGALINPAFNGSGTATKFVGAAIGSVQTAGTLGTTVGLDIGVTYALAGSTKWAMQVGNYQSYHQGPVLLAASAFPTSTATGVTLSQSPLLVSSGSPTITLVGSQDYISWLVNDTITVAGTAVNAALYNLGVYPKIIASSGTTGLAAAGFSTAPVFAGTDTYGSMTGLNLSASIQAPATNVYGINSAIVQTTATTASTVTVFSGQTVRTSGTWTTLIGLSLTSLNGGTTTYGFQIGNYLNYIQGKLALGAAAAPNFVLDIQSGSESYAVDAVTYAATITLDVTKGNVHTITTVAATGNATINATTFTSFNGEVILVITNDATAGRVITFGTNFKSTGTLTGTASKTAVVTFIGVGGTLYEKSRVTGL